MARRLWYEVAPRYTGGSPALVDQRTAEKVAQEEKEAYERREFINDPDTGLDGIAWCWCQSGMTISWRCLITGKTGEFKLKKDEPCIQWPWKAAK